MFFCGFAEHQKVDGHSSRLGTLPAREFLVDQVHGSGVPDRFWSSTIASALVIV
jgi:hypothetical protein